MKFKRSKQSRGRGSWTHGWGGKKRHRGAGNRGGRGNAGSGKRGDAKKPSYWKDRSVGRNGFASKSRTRIVVVSVGELNKNMDSFVEQNIATKKGDTYVINLAELGCDKVLGTGRVTKKMEITVTYVTDSARQKVEAAGGSFVTESAEETSDDA